MASSPMASAIAVPASQSASVSSTFPWNDRRKPRLTSARARSGPAAGKRSSTLVSQYVPSPSRQEICQYP